MVFSLFSKSRRPAHPNASTGGPLIYAVGDIHGRLDLLDQLLHKIALDAQTLSPTHKFIMVFLGDYVDRGPASREVIERMLALRRQAPFEVVTLKGNHEEALLDFLDDARNGPAWVQFGASETLASYGVAAPAMRTDLTQWEEVRQKLAEAMPAAHLEFLQGLQTAATCGDYIFVHAGLRPGVPLDQQSDYDMMWIREDFLRNRKPFEKVVVHGHTPTEEAHVGDIRIGIDTGAYATGVLTAICLRDQDRRLIQTE